jgi:hypothetical protein
MPHTIHVTLDSYLRRCPMCGRPLFADYINTRTVIAELLSFRLRMRIRRCHYDPCSRAYVPYRPELECHFAIPHHKLSFHLMNPVQRGLSLRKEEAAWAKAGIRIGRTTIANSRHAWSALPTKVSQGIRTLQNASPRTKFVLLDVFRIGNGRWHILDCASRTILATGVRDLRDSLEEIRSTLTIPILGIFSSDQSLLLNTIATVFGPHKGDGSLISLAEYHKEQYTLPSHAKQGLPDEYGRLYDIPSRFSNILLDRAYFDIQWPISDPTEIPPTFEQMIAMRKWRLRYDKDSTR